MRTYEDTFSGEKIYPGKVCRGSSTHPSQLTLVQCQSWGNGDKTASLKGEAGGLELIGVRSNRENSTFVVTARSSAFRTARQNPFSYSARTRVGLRGQHFTDGNIRKASQRYVCNTIASERGDALSLSLRIGGAPSSHTLPLDHSKTTCLPTN